IEKYVERGSLSSGWPDHFIAFAAPFIAEGNVVFFLMTLAGGDILRAGKNVSRCSVGPDYPGLKHNRIFKVISSTCLEAHVPVHSLALVKANACGRHQLPAAKQFAVDQAIGSKSRKKKATGTA